MTAPDWTTTAGAPRDSRGLGPGRLRWQAGWDPETRCKTPDPKNDASPACAGFRASPLLDGKKWWVKAHGARKRAVRQLRAAGYEARRLWAREDNGWRTHGAHQAPSWVYTDGPAKGREAIDPWVRAAELHRCSSDFEVLPRVNRGGQFLTLAIPKSCGQDHVCPVCSARHSRLIARQVRAHLAETNSGAALALVTLTQRAIPGESLHSALERWREAWRLTMRGRPGRRLRRLINGYYYGIEVTRNEQIGHWHLHGHVVIELHAKERRRGECLDDLCGAAPGAPCRSKVSGADMQGVHKGRSWECTGAPVDEAQARTWMARAWESATRSASGDDGWDPIAGIWDDKNEPKSAAVRRLMRGDYSGNWWRSIDPASKKEIYQACKYPTPVAKLGAVALAEFLAATHGRRWHEGGWAWRSIRKEGSEAIEAQSETDEKAIDLGISIGSLAPGHSPSLDTILKGRGTDPTVIGGGPAAIVQVGDGFELSGRRRRAVEITGGSIGEECAGSVEWVLSADARDLAEQWAREGWAQVGRREIGRMVPCGADSEDLVIQILKHPSGRSEIRHVRWEVTHHPTLTISAQLAAAIVRRTDDLLLGKPDPGDPTIDPRYLLPA